MAYASTLVAHGTGQGMVIATGDHTEIGRINDLISSADIIATPLTIKIQQFSHVLLYAILGLAAVTFVVGFFEWILVLGFSALFSMVIALEKKIQRRF